jgi:hypothetical protein
MGRAIELARKLLQQKFHLLDVGEKLLIGSAPIKLAVVKKNALKIFMTLRASNSFITRIDS